MGFAGVVLVGVVLTDVVGVVLVEEDVVVLPALVSFVPEGGVLVTG